VEENLKTAVKISGKTALKWILVFALGNIVTLITFLIALYNNIELAGRGHGTIMIFPFVLLATNFLAFLLIFGAPVFLAIYFMIANKISIQTAIYLLSKGKAGNYISSKVGALTIKITEKEGWRKEFTEGAVLKAKILQLIKEDKGTSKLQCKVINFGFKKVKLDEIDFQDENLNLSDFLTNKFNDFVSETAKPSLKLFWIFIIIQIAFLIGSTIVSLGIPIGLIFS
jgi:hypothetical protein